MRYTQWWRQPKLQLTDDLESVTTGICAICLDDLTDLAAEECFPPPPRQSKSCQPSCRAWTASLVGHGLLRLPCGHLFHSSCVEKWLVRDSKCPCCRVAVTSRKHCTCICLRPAGEPTATPIGQAAAAIDTPSAEGAAASPKGLPEAWGPSSQQ